MHPTEIPDKIRAETDADGIEVPVKVPCIEGLIDDVAAAAKAMGMEFIDPVTVRRMEKAGVALDHLGQMRMSRMGLFLTNQGLLHANSQMLAAMGRAPTDEAKAEMARVVGFLAGKIALVSKETRESTEITERAANLHAKVKSFQPCAIVQNNYYGKLTAKPTSSKHGEKEAQENAARGPG